MLKKKKKEERKKRKILLSIGRSPPQGSPQDVLRVLQVPVNSESLPTLFPFQGTSFCQLLLISP